MKLLRVGKGGGPEKKALEGGDQFEDWVARKLLLLDIVHKVPETAYNLKMIFDALNLQGLEYKLTGDFAFFMPLLGLLKGCGSCNPCPLCDQERCKVGGDGAKWVDHQYINLCSMGSLLGNFASWAMEGEREEAKSHLNLLASTMAMSITLLATCSECPH